MITKQSTMDNLIDFSNEYGDQELIELMTKWLQLHMGRNYKISNEADRTSKLNDQLEVINRLRNRLQELKENDFKYQLCKMDMMLILMQETINL